MKRCILTLLALSLCCCVSAQSVFRLHYWFDDQFADGITVTSSNGRWQSPIEASHLSDGFHTFYVQVQDSTGQWFSPSSYLFYRLPDTVTEHQVHYTCWFDEDYEHTQSDSVSAGSLLLDAGALATGFHTVNFQFNFSNSVSFKSYLFYKSPSMPSATDSMIYIFWFDQDYEHRHSGRFLSEHLVFDIDSLQTGFHTINAQFKSGKDVTIKSFLFYKKPHAEIQIVRYEYWLNDLDSLAQVVNLTPQDTVNLVALLQLAQQPIRSSYFHFNPNGGIPVVNAKNDIHFRFYNAEGRQASKTMPYVDITVIDTIYADTLERDTTKVVMAPTGNEIHWFKLSAGVGDSLSFHTDKPCTMQLFAPSGAEVMNAKGQKSLTWKGCHTWEAGDYYLAVHDVEDTGTIAVSYQWIYRYAVLAWDVHRVGNGGLSTITFEGNGFANLDTVYLIKGLDSVPALYIGRESNTTTAVIFNLENVDTGMYRAVFMYEDEDLYKSNVVYVEEVRPIVLTTTCSYPETFLRGSTVTYTYTITNTGNMTAYNVPLHIYIESPTLDGIYHIDVSGINIPSIIDEWNLDYLSEIEKKELIEWANEQGDDHCFYKFISIDTISNDSVVHRANYFLVTIAPYATKTIQLSITSNDSVELWISLPDSIPAINVSFENESYRNLLQPDTKSGDRYCCAADMIQCVLSITADVLDIASLVSAISTILMAETGVGAIVGGAATISTMVTNCVVSAASVIHSNISTMLCSENDLAFPKLAMAAAVNSFVGSLSGCLTQMIPGGKITRAIAEAISHATNAGSMVSLYTDLSNCAQTFVDFFLKNQNCPRTPPSLGGVSMPQVPVDPNDISGYMAESGSLAVGIEHLLLPYMIEFENDTVFATTHANTVVVRDTLDGSVFDLSSFSAVSFAIGDDVTTINGGQSFIRTVDMRPDINVLAQVQLDYQIDSTFAVATWTFSSLDPMTLQPTVADTLGFLDIGGTGEVNFTINRKANLPDNTFIDNRAWIKFDNENPIATSTWRNIIDATPPASNIDSVAYIGDTAIVTVTATDNLSGVWRYHIYAQISDDMLLPVAMNVPIDSTATFVSPVGAVQLHSTAVDSAGNEEAVSITPPCTTVYDTINATVCDGYTWFDSVYYVSGSYVRTMQSAISGGCDTITTLNLIVNHSTTGDTTASACDSFIWWSENYTNSMDTPTHVYTNAAGCDSTVTLHLTINYSTETTLADTADDSYTWHDSTYTESGTYIWHGTTDAGCDSTVTLLLMVNHVSIEVIDNNGINVMVYPNPTTGWLTIDADDVISVGVFNQAGHNVATYEQSNRINLSELASGSYLLKIHLKRGTALQRVILLRRSSEE